MKGNEDGLDRPGVMPSNEVVRFSIVVRNQTRAAPSRPRGWWLGVERGPVPDQTVSKSDVSSLGWHCSVHGCQWGLEGLEFTSFLAGPERGRRAGGGKIGSLRQFFGIFPSKSSNLFWTFDAHDKSARGDHG